jgi:hypothetical protein
MNTAILRNNQSPEINFVKCVFTPEMQASNDDVFKSPDVKIREITSIIEKKKWMKSFIKHYSGEKTSLHSHMFSKVSRFFVGSIKGKDVGFIRITNYTNVFKEHYSSQVWNASDAYVKNIYRGQSVLRQLLEYVILNCQVKMVRLETSRLAENYNYYKSLGFTFSRMVGNGSLSISVIEDLKDSFIKIASSPR